MPEPIYYYRRGRQNKDEEIIIGGAMMRWAYYHRLGKAISGILFKHAWPSRMGGWLASRRWSRRQIGPFIRNLHIDPGEFSEPPESFLSFNAFFSRRLKAGARPFSAEPQELASPADGRVIVHPRLQQQMVLPVKGKSFTVEALLGRSAAECYNGSLAIVRLCPADYHRFHFPCEGRVLDQQRIRGRYHSVNPLILRLGIDVFSENERQVAMLENELFGRFAYVEVGAFGVGSIVQTYRGLTFAKGEEKGYFQYGGSTIILVFQPGRIRFAEDLLAHSAEGYETFLKAGEELGRAV